MLQSFMPGCLVLEPLELIKDNSDIDIVIEGDGISLSVVAGLQDRLEQSSLPFKVDLLVKHRITSNELLAHIDTYGIKLK